MRFWNFIFGKNRITTIQDDFFGEIKDCNGYFEGKMFFTPSKSSIEIHISGKKITDFHMAFFNELENKYDGLLPTLKSCFEEEFKNRGENFEIKNFNEEFILVFISLPEHEDTEWELSFETHHDKNHTFSGIFKNWGFKNVHIDG
jgi:hypothetical protein